MSHYGKKYLIETIRVLPYIGAATLGGATHLAMKALNGENISKIYILISMFISYNAAYLAFNWIIANLDTWPASYLNIASWIAAFSGSTIINRIPGVFNKLLERVTKKIENGKE